MPTVRVETNLGLEAFPDSFMSNFVVGLAEILGKDKNLMKYVFDTKKNMTMVRSTLPLAEEGLTFLSLKM